MSARSSQRARGGPRAAVVGRRGRFLVAEPIFEPAPEVALGRRERASEGALVLVDLDPRGRARVLRPLGDPDVARDVVEALMWERGERRDFPSAVEEEARSTAERVAADRDGREDLTGLATFTVDPRSAHDFDDAVSARREGEAIRLWVHIADVSAHVRPGSALDAEALRRATSVYAPGALEPMLPHVLSSDACSLAPEVERAAVTAEFLLGPEGETRDPRFYRSVIRSDARLDYEGLDEIFAGRERAPAQAAEPLDLARRAAAVLAERRPASSLSMDRAEPEFSFDGQGHVTGARPVVQTESHRLIEHLMVRTNELVAELLDRKRLPALFRVHEPPDPEAVLHLLDRLAALDVPTPPAPDHIGPSQAADLAGEASRMIAAESERRGHGGEAYTTMLLRTMKQAHYTHRNLGHAGLGSEAYAHFTSPIRRYPDLVAHRALLAATGAGEEPPPAEQVREAGPHCSTREREAAKVEYAADDVCACFLLRRELDEAGWGTTFEGEVIGLVGGGAFVRFGEGGLQEGFLPVRRIPGDHYDLDSTETALVGRRSGGAVRLGDPVTVRVERIEAARGRTDLSVAEPGERQAGKAHGRGANRPPKARRAGRKQPRRSGSGRGARRGKGR